MTTGYQPFQHKSATLSPCGNYRYDLRRWEPNPQRELGIIMLNPSTADAEKDDPTIKKCVGFARANGFDAIRVVNLFAFRTKDPPELKRQAKAGFPVVGPDNDQWILDVAKAITHRGGQILVAWGCHGSLQGRDRAVLDLLKEYDLACLGDLSKEGLPQHPLMLGYAKPMFNFRSLSTLRQVVGA